MDYRIEEHAEQNEISDNNNIGLPKRFKVFTRSTIDKISKLHNLNHRLINEMKIVAHVLPFKVNNYVLDNLIDWNEVPNDPIFRLVFPQKNMLIPKHFRKMKKALKSESKKIIKSTAKEIRMELNPYPAGQISYNVPTFQRKKLNGVQHKYRETALLFPRSGQTCHAYCTFCFRWSQFVSLKTKDKFGVKSVDNFIAYLQENPEITDVLITGGDPMIMCFNRLVRFIQPIVNAEIPHLRTIRIGSKSLTYWPMRYIDDPDSDYVLGLFSNITDKGLNLCFMAHINHYQEMESFYFKMAVEEIKKTGAQILTQTPLLNQINASSDILAKMWKLQIDYNMVPYYLFIARDTGAQHYFSVPLVKAWEIFSKAYTKVSGICRTIRGPSMSCSPGKVNVLGPTKINGEKVLALSFIQGRNPSWVNKPFFAKYNPKAIWLSDLEPAFDEQFFFEKDYDKFLGPYNEIKKYID
ncbi:MAG: 4Fe-4S cluster-binding domain-containing protein [Asgard group archaeon]|nr:4Fe-4S cluster-binding domain-containing protein [Asgard group archaeon]